jgi:hypothetical protein
MTTRKNRYTWDELQEIAQKHGLIVEPPPAPKRAKPDPGVSNLKAAIKAKREANKPKATTPEASRGLPTTKVHYVKDGGRLEYVRGEWVERDEKHWEFHGRYGYQKLLEVIEPGPPTVLEDGFIKRGCLVCGRSEIVADKVKFGRHWGGMCLECHPAWSKLDPPQKKGFENLGRFASLRLQQEGFLTEDLEREVEDESGHTRLQPLYLRRWKDRTWCYRLHSDRVADPTIQEPPPTSFGYLSKAKVAEGVEE